MSGATLFVYGTLKRGLRNHYLLGNPKFLGEAVTLPRYRLIDLGEHPGLLERGTTAIRGELWLVASQALAHVDQFEGIPYPFDRRPIMIQNFADSVEAYFFLGDASRGRDCGDRWPAAT